MNQNNWHGIGRLSMDPMFTEHTRSDGTPGYRVFFRVAITRNYDRGRPREEQRSSFVPVVAWGNAAKQHAQYLRKGTEVAISGELIVDTQRDPETGKFGPDQWYVQANDVQYGQPSIKNATAEQVAARQQALQQRAIELAAAAAPPPAQATTGISQGVEVPNVASPPTTGLPVAGSVAPSPFEITMDA